MASMSTEDSFVLTELFSSAYDYAIKRTTELISVSKPQFISDFIHIWKTYPSFDLSPSRYLNLIRSDLLEFLESFRIPYPQRITSRLKTILRSTGISEFLLDDMDIFLSSSTQSESNEDRPVAEYETESLSPVKTPLEHLKRTTKSESKQHPKKENFRMKHIRGVKRVIRQLQKGELLPTKYTNRANKHLSIQMWNDLKHSYMAHCGDLGQFADTRNGPIIDGKSKRRTKGDTSDGQMRSYNADYCRSFFSSPSVLPFYHQYCDFMYSGEPEDICMKMEYRCCSVGVGTHSPSCETAWKNVHKYAKEGMIEELGAFMDNE